MDKSAGEGTLFVISAPSGAGKSTLVGRLMDALERLSFSVSWTTRSPRPGEVDGRDYHFSGRGRFEQLILEGAFLEWAEVHGQLYGTGRRETLTALAEGKDLVLDIDVQGAAKLRESGVEHVSVFILPPSREVLVERLLGRGTESSEALERRLENAREEILQYDAFDHIVINDDLDRATEELVAIVRAARTERSRRQAVAASIVRDFAPGRGEV